MAKRENQLQAQDDQAAGTTPAGGGGAQWALMVVAGIAALGAFATLFMVWLRSASPDGEAQLRIAMDEYVAGRHEIAERLATDIEVDAEERAEAYRLKTFLVGAAKLSQALQQQDPREMRLRIAVGAPLLEELVREGFPPGRGAEGKRLLGISLHAAGRFDEAIAPLNAAMEENPMYERELLLPLADAKQRASGVTADQAVTDLERWFDLPNLTQDGIDEAHIIKARVLLELGRWSEAEQALSRVQNERLLDMVQLIQSQLLIGQARAIIDEQKISTQMERRSPVGRQSGQDANVAAAPIPLAAKELLNDAIGLLEKLNHRNDLQYGASTGYLTGVAYRLAGDDETALGVFAALRQNTKHPAESIAAGVEEVELLAEIGQAADAVLAAKAILRDMGNPVEFDPKWMSLTEFRTRLEVVAQVMRSGNYFAESIELAQNLPPLVEPADAVLMEAISHREWGDYLSRMKPSADPEVRQREQNESREQYRLAGEKYQQVAKLRFAEPDYIDLTWQAIDAFQAGRAYEESLALLQEYLLYEDRARLPRGLLLQGRALLALDKPQESLRPLTDLIEEYPRDSLRYEARLLSAIARAELGEVEVPRQQLEQNLEEERLSPESPVFRDSLYVLGELLYRQALREHLKLTEPKPIVGRIAPGDQPAADVAQAFHANQELLNQAIQRLYEAEVRDRRFDNGQRARRAAYLYAEANRLAAFWPTIQANHPDTIDSARRQLERSRNEYLTAAQGAFSALRKELASDVGEQTDLLPWEEGMLRSCYMGIGDTLFDMGEYELAAEAYQTTSQEYLNEPIALEAMLQQSRCYQQMGKDADAQLVFRQAARVLERMPAEMDTRFAETTRYDRTNWQSLLTWLQRS